MRDIVALGEMLIDFTMQGVNSQGQRLFAQNAGGAPANVAAAAAKLGAKVAFIGKAGNALRLHIRYFVISILLSAMAQALILCRIQML